MIGGSYPNLSFQTFFVSKEISKCPLISEIISLSERFKAIDLLKNIIDISISLRYGKRILINAKNSDFWKIKDEDFLEIIDYDPFKKVLMAIGLKEPRIETPVHWLIHHARNEVNAIIQIDDVQLVGQLEKKIPLIERDYPMGTLDQIKEILRLLSNSKKILINNQSAIFIGSNMKDAEDLVLCTYEEMK
jgi:hypothetical protein